MSRNTLAAVALLALIATSVLSAGDVYTGSAPKSKTSALDQRTDFEKLEDQVDDMTFWVDEALHMIDAQRRRIEDLEDAMADNQAFIDDLKSHVDIGSSSVTLSASTIYLDADVVEVDGDLKSDNVETGGVDAETYTPGVGNLW